MSKEDFDADREKIKELSHWMSTTPEGEEVIEAIRKNAGAMATIQVMVMLSKPSEIHSVLGLLFGFGFREGYEAGVRDSEE
jgi:hypothetical protein